MGVSWVTCAFEGCESQTKSFGSACDHYCNDHRDLSCVCCERQSVRYCGASLSPVSAKGYFCPEPICNYCAHSSLQHGYSHLKRRDHPAFYGEAYATDREVSANEDPTQQSDPPVKVDWMASTDHTLDDVNKMVDMIGQIVEDTNPPKITGQHRIGVSYDYGVINVNCVAFDVFFEFRGAQPLGVRRLEIRDPVSSDDDYALLATRYFVVQRRSESEKSISQRNADDLRDTILSEHGTLEEAIQAVLGD